ncbi:sulfotransferase [Streptomyces sp. SID10853]|uniref:sulfotransferase family protein n=1 Tax=Streptomyces sp. SID10853 TaxID=2706028 RepID=UPI0013C1643A|nr:sulfotransferase [Streptomyces sp. SID10853]NDZ77394.1 sulfotransferase [Streptomyces sp. SID10853]
MTAKDTRTVGTADELLALAAETTGLTDFGDDDYREGLEVLISSFDADSRLTPHGVTIARAMMTKALAGRARSEAAFARHPEHTEVGVERPVFVCGLMRTGSTALHRLLSADPAHQGIETWLAEAPQPRPAREDWPSHPEFQRSQAHFAARQRAEAELMKVHFMDADEVEECWQLLQQSMRSVAFECVSYLPTYSKWLAGQDWTGTYARHKKNLQLIGANDPGKRWVLKNPSHVFAIDEIMSVYPDALIIRTHRAPRTAMASTCSLVEQGKHDMSAALDRETIGRTQLGLWARGIEHFDAARRRYDPRQFLDVDYQGFVTDPLGTVESIYAHFGLEFTAEARGAIEAAHRKSLGAHRRPDHRYSLEDFGLTGTEVDERFPAHA